MSIRSKLAHYYRFALIGTTSSGKTCMLAKLASGRDSNTRFSSASIPLGDFAPNTSEGDDPLKWSEERRLQESFRIGEERIEAAVAKFSNHQRPDATSTDDTRPMMRFKLSDCNERGDFYIWTEDYAGELLNKKGLEDETSLSTKLKNNLLQNDGLVIIVEAAETPKEMEKVRQQIETLKHFFSVLTEEEKREGRLHNIPVAIVITKWDRISKEINFDNPNKERALLSDYFEKNKIYEQIITAAQSNAMDLQVEVNADCPTAIVRGNTAVFPVSAFGKSELDGEGNDFPLDSQSFCLVEPFYWLASRCDEIRVSELEESVKAKKFFWPFGFSKIQRQVKVLKRFIQGKNPCKERFHNARVSLFKKTVLCFFTWILIGYCAWAGWNQYQFKSWETTMRQPESTAESFSRLKKNFENYQKSFYYAWLGHPGKKRTEDAIEFINKSIENLYWHPTEVLSQNAGMAKEYLDHFPNGIHAKDAHKYIQDWNKEQEEKAWNAVEIAQTRDEKKKLAQKYLDGFDKEGTARYRSEAWDLIHEAETGEAWDHDLDGYNHVCNGKDCIKIVEKLSELFSKHEDRCKAQIEALPKLILDKLDEKARDASKQDMISEYENCNRSVEALENKLRERNKDTLADCVHNDLFITINSKKTTTIDQLDKELYEEVRRRKSDTACKNYLDTMETLGGAMIKQVESYKAFLESKNGKFKSVSINVSVRWTANAYNSKHIQNVVINGITINKQGAIPKGGNSENIGSVNLKDKSLNDDIKVHVRFVTKDNIYNWNNVEWINESRTYPLSSLLSGKEIDIVYDNKTFGTISIVANIPDLKEPELPTWHK